MILFWSFSEFRQFDGLSRFGVKYWGLYPNSNITLPVIDCIENLYQIYGAGFYLIRIKKQHNIEISI